MTGRLSFPKAAAIWTVLACITISDEGVADHQNVSVEPLAAYKKLEPSSVTVSGISSGAFFAHQFHVAYSSLVKGVGIVAGGPYACADQVDSITPPLGNPFFVALVPRRVVASLAVCTHFGRSDFKQAGWQFPGKPDADDSQKAAIRSHAEKMIDDPGNLANSRVWLFHGDKDMGVPKSTMQELRNFYQKMGVPAGNIAVKDGPDAKHGMPIKALPSGVLEGTVSSPTHPFWSDATTAPPNCFFGTYIPTPRPHPGAALVLAGSSASTRLSSSMKRRGVRAYTSRAICMCRQPARTGQNLGQSAVCTLHSTVVSKMWAESTTSSFETPDTMTGLTPTTLSFFTPKPRHGCVWQI